MATRKQGSKHCKYQSHTFEWKMKLELYTNFTELTPMVSPFFKFCGYYCQLYYYPQNIRDLKFIYGGIKGYPAPYRKEVSCYYSLSFINHYGKEQFTKEGRIRSSEKTIHAALFEHGVESLNNINHTFTFCFSWYEDDGYVFNQEIKTAIESETPKEEMPVLFLRDVRSDKESSANTKRATQTESIQPSSPKSFINCEDEKSDNLLEILSKDLGSFYEDKTNADCVLRVNDTEFPVHRSVLSARSKVFAAMFLNDTTEIRIEKVDIQDVNAGALGDVLYYIYTGKIRGLSPETAVWMYVVSDKYALIDCRKKCLDFLKNNLTLENVCDAALLAHTHGETELENEILKFIDNRLEDLLQNDNWRNFSDTHYKLANELICSAFKASKKKKQKFSH